MHRRELLARCRELNVRAAEVEHQIGRLVQRLAPHLVELPGCGHVPTWDDPDLVARVVLAGARRKR